MYSDFPDAILLWYLTQKSWFSLHDYYLFLHVKFLSIKTIFSTSPQYSIGTNRNPIAESSQS